MRVLCCCGLLLPSAASAESTGVLPLTRVRLYETGVGYFERSGQLRGGTTLPIPAAQLDDALKTLVVLDDDEERSLKGVNFATPVTEQLGRALARLPTDSAAPLDLEALARSLTGAEVELQLAAGRHRGRLLQVLAAADSGIERCLPGVPLEAAQAETDRCVLQKQPGLILLRDGSELMRVALSDVQRLRPLAAGDVVRLRAALEASPAGRDAQHALQIRGKLSERVTLGYVAEAPLWRTTYRLVLGQSGVWLQAWALLHNDSDERWNDVRVELVNGEPDSFLFPLAAPRYARRRLVTPLNELASVPQLLTGSADELWDNGGNEGAGGLGLGIRAGNSDIGPIHPAEATAPGDRESSLLEIGDLAAIDAARGEEIGGLFLYALPAPVTLAAHDSLLVPLLHEQITAERVSFSPADGMEALSALVVHNTTRQTLPDGTIAIFEAGGFGGESALGRLKPGQQRRVAFGRDLDLEIEKKSWESDEKAQLVQLRRNGLVEHFQRVEQRRFELRNRSAVERTVQLELPVVNNARIEGADALAVLDGEEPCAVFHVPPASTRNVELRITEGIERDHDLKQLGSKGLYRLASEAQLPPAQRAALTRAAGQLEERERRELRARQLSAEIDLLQRKAARVQQSLPIVAKADPDRGSALASDLVRTQSKLSAYERERAALNVAVPWRAALAALEAL